MPGANRHRHQTKEPTMAPTTIIIADGSEVCTGCDYSTDRCHCADED